MRTRGRVSRLLAAVTFAATALVAVQPRAQVYSSSRVPALDGQQPPGTLPNRLVGDVGIAERFGETVPSDAPFLDESGRTVRLSGLLGRERPVLLVFVYHSCPMLCSLALDGVAEAVAATDDLRPGRDYEVVAVSMDPRDTPARAAEAKARYVAAIGDPSVAAGMHFWTVTEATEASVKGLAEAVGFGYAWDAATEEYAHNAALIMLSPSGTVTRYLYGIAYPPRDVRLALVEAGDGTVGTPFDRFLMTCYQFDHESRSYSLAALGLLKIGGGLLLVVFGGAMLWFWRREGHRQRQPPSWDLDADDASRLSA